MDFIWTLWEGKAFEVKGEEIGKNRRSDIFVCRVRSGDLTG